MRRTILGTAAVFLFAVAPLAAQSRDMAQEVRQYVSVDAPVIALIHARLVDGTGTPAKDDQTVIIRGEKVVAVGKTGTVAVPADARVIDVTGKTIIPGIVGLHDHMYYGFPNGNYKFMGESYPRLFLSAGVTTVRTTGSFDPYQELNLKRRVDSLQVAGPSIVVTGP